MSNILDQAKMKAALDELNQGLNFFKSRAMNYAMENIELRAMVTSLTAQVEELQKSKDPSNAKQKPSPSPLNGGGGAQSEVREASGSAESRRI